MNPGMKPTARVLRSGEVLWPGYDAGQSVGVPRGIVEMSDVLYKYLSSNRPMRWISRRHVRFILRVVNKLSCDRHSLRLADIGCGDSYVGAAVLMNCPAIERVVGVDVDPHKLAISRELYRQNGLDAEVLEGSIYKLPFEDRAFDVVLCSEVLEHLSDVDSAMSELARITKGFLILSVPFDLVFRTANVARGAYLRQLGNPPNHVQHFSRCSFATRVARHAEACCSSVAACLWIVAVARPHRGTRTEARSG